MEHPNLDLNGVWDGTNCKFTVLFPIVELSSGEDIADSESERTRELRQKVGRYITDPSVKLEHFRGLTADREHSLQILEEELTNPSGGIVIIEGKYLRPPKLRADELKECLDIVAGIYSDVMFERAHPDTSHT